MTRPVKGHAEEVRSVRNVTAVWCRVVQCSAAWCNVEQRVALCCSVMQCVAVRCSVLQVHIQKSLGRSANSV